MRVFADLIVAESSEEGSEEEGHDEDDGIEEIAETDENSEDEDEDAGNGAEDLDDPDTQETSDMSFDEGLPTQGLSSGVRRVMAEIFGSLA